MKWPFVSRRRVDDLAAQHQYTVEQFAKASKARDTAEFNRGQALRQLAEAEAANRRLAGRNLELGVRLSAYAESDPEYVAGLEKRLDRALKACARYLDAYHAEKRRTAHLQRRLDDATGLNSAAVIAGARWQERRDDKRPRLEGADL